MAWNATARAPKPPFVIATSAGSQLSPVRSVKLRATVACDRGSLILYANQSVDWGSILARSAST
jgi:hypothetical protein